MTAPTLPGLDLEPHPSEPSEPRSLKGPPATSPALEPSKVAAAAFHAQQFLGTLDPQERAAVSVRSRFYTIPWIRRAGAVDATDCLPLEPSPAPTAKPPDDACHAAYLVVATKIFSRTAADLSQFVASAKAGQARGESLDPGEVSKSHDRLCFWLDSAPKHAAALCQPAMAEAVETIGRLKKEFHGLLC